MPPSEPMPSRWAFDLAHKVEMDGHYSGAWYRHDGGSSWRLVIARALDAAKAEGRVGLRSGRGMTLTLPTYEREIARMEVPRTGPRVSVRCWKCGHRARRRVYTLGWPVGQRGKVRSYGECPRRFGGGLFPGDRGWSCGGTMHPAEARKRVLRAALRHDRAGGNRASEYDL